jgi:hypothetical protein
MTGYVKDRWVLSVFQQKWRCDATTNCTLLRNRDRRKLDSCLRDCKATTAIPEHAVLMGWNWENELQLAIPHA